MKNFKNKHIILVFMLLAFQNLQAQVVSQCWKYIDADTSGSLAISTNDMLYCWGANHVGQIGNNTTIDQNTPILITTNTWKTAVKYGGHCLAIKSDGTLWGWGNNYNGVLGTNPNSLIPLQIGTDNDWEKIATGMSHCLAIKTNGTLWSWGKGNSGQLGQGTVGLSIAILPTQIGIDNNWTAVSCGDIHSIALNLYGDVYTFGNNSDGQIGNGTTTNVNTPFWANSGSSAPTIIKIAAGSRTSFAISNTGALFACGDNFSGQIGNGTTTDVLNSVQIGTDSWLDIASGVGTTLGIKADGSLWAWGWNNSSFGVATPTTSLIPIQIGTATHWKSLAVGLHSMALTINNTISTAGYYNNGAIGLGSGVTSVDTFTQIGNTINCDSSSDCNVVSDDFSNSSLWVHPHLPAATQCTITYNTIGINTNQFQFLQSRDNSFNYMYRGISTVSNTHFKADIDFTHQSTIPGWGAGHTLLAINSTNKPFFNDPSISTGGTPCAAATIGVANSIQDGIALVYASALVSGVSTFEFRCYVKDGGLPVLVAAVPVTGGGVYYPRIERTSATTGTLSVFSDPLRTIHIAPAVNFTMPATVTNLNTVVIGTNEWQESDRMLTGHLDNLCISNLPDTSDCLTAKYYFDFGDTRDDLGHNDGINHGATLTTDRFGIANAAYYFDGTLNQYIKVPNHSTNNFTTDFSVAYWVLIDSNNGTNAAIITKHETGSWNGYTFGANGTDMGYCNGPGSYTFYTASGAMQDACANSLIANNTNTWMHIVGTHNIATNQSKLYVNNVLQTDIGQSSGVIPNLADLIFGGVETSLGSGIYTTNFQGKLDDISLYKCVLDSIQIDSLYHVGAWATAVSDAGFTNNRLQVYPNPTHNALYINATHNIQKVEIFNLVGQQLFSQAYSNNKLELSLSQLKTGSYFIKIVQDNNTQIIKISKE